MPSVGSHLSCFCFKDSLLSSVSFSFLEAARLSGISFCYSPRHIHVDSINKEIKGMFYTSLCSNFLS